MAPRISVQPDALEALADELAGLAAALSTDGDRCRSAAVVLDTALGGREGAAAGAVAIAWGTRAGALAEGTRAAAGTLRAVAAAYRGADEVLAGRLGGPVLRNGHRPC
jgi:uncharacterized protein YukE